MATLPRCATPSTECLMLLDDAVSFSQALGELYRAHTRAPLPYEVPELEELEDAAGKARPARGAGFRQNRRNAT